MGSPPHPRILWLSHLRSKGSVSSTQSRGASPAHPTCQRECRLATYRWHGCWVCEALCRHHVVRIETNPLSVYPNHAVLKKDVCPWTREGAWSCVSERNCSPVAKIRSATRPSDSSLPACGSSMAFAVPWLHNLIAVLKDASEIQVDIAQVSREKLLHKRTVLQKRHAMLWRGSLPGQYDR